MNENLSLNPELNLPGGGEISLADSSSQNSNDPMKSHYMTVIKAITDGRLVPFLGAGANLCGRKKGSPWGEGKCLPSGYELSAHLANSFGYPSSDNGNLARVCQYITIKDGSGPLYDELRRLFNNDYPSTPLHDFLAKIPGTLREKGYPNTTDPLRRRFIIVTTNYDDVLEKAFRNAGEPFHVVTYLADMADRELCGKFLHWPDGGEPNMIEASNSYKGLLNDENPVILKIHGAIDRATSQYDSFVITEDHYIDYLTRTDISNLLPVPIPAILKRSNFLFMGYSLCDWNLRVILRRIWGEQKLTYKSWAIQLNPEELDLKFWENRDVQIFNKPLDSYIAALDRELESWPKSGGGL